MDQLRLGEDIIKEGRSLRANALRSLPALFLVDPPRQPSLDASPHQPSLFEQRIADLPPGELHDQWCEWNYSVPRPPTILPEDAPDSVRLQIAVVYLSMTAKYVRRHDDTLPPRSRMVAEFYGVPHHDLIVASEQYDQNCRAAFSKRRDPVATPSLVTTPRPPRRPDYLELLSPPASQLGNDAARPLPRAPRPVERPPPARQPRVSSRVPRPARPETALPRPTLPDIAYLLHRRPATATPATPRRAPVRPIRREQVVYLDDIVPAPPVDQRPPSPTSSTASDNSTPSLCPTEPPRMPTGVDFHPNFCPGCDLFIDPRTDRGTLFNPTPCPRCGLPLPIPYRRGPRL